MKRRILLVDDEPQMLLAMKEILLREGYEVATAASGIEAVAMSQKANKPFNLLITDLKMPRMNGLELINYFRKHYPLTRLMLVTAYGSVNSAVEAMKMGAVDYLMKPFNSEMLVDAVSKALGGTSIENENREIMTKNPNMLKIIRLASQAAATDATVLIQAESGTGKELLARYIHNASRRREGPFVAVNCAALPDNLLESELMGHEKGAFTGASAAKPGKFELANGGTILLDEIGEMAPILQAKILRVIQEKEVDRIGGAKPIPIDVRIIATTNRDLAEMVKKGEFRQDLYFRLNVIPLKIPPLRHRPDDIPLLVEYFFKKYSSHQSSSFEDFISREEIEKLQRYHWPGNVRELENVIQRAVILSQDGKFRVSYWLEGESPKPDVPEAGMSLKEMEKALILSTLEKTAGNKTQAARILQISVRTLRNKLKEMQQVEV